MEMQIYLGRMERGKIKFPRLTLVSNNILSIRDMILEFSKFWTNWWRVIDIRHTTIPRLKSAKSFLDIT